MIEYSNSQISELIDDYIHNARNRAILKDRLIDGLTKGYLYPQYEKPYTQYSYASEPEPVENTVNYNSDAEFFRLANGMEYDKVWRIIAELMETLQVINPRLYAGVVKKLKAQ